MKFIFYPDNLTMFDGRVSAFFDESGHKAIAKTDMMGLEENSLCTQEGEALNAAYTLEKWIPLENLKISFRLSVKKAGNFGLLMLRHGGYVRYDSGAIQVHLVTETGELSVDLTNNWKLTEETFDLSIIRDGSRMFFEVGEDGLEIEVPEECSRGLEITGLLGPMSETDMRVGSIRVDRLV